MADFIRFVLVWNTCMKKFIKTQTRPDSKFYLPITWVLLAGTDSVETSVKDTGDNYNELSPFQIIIQP